MPMRGITAKLFIAFGGSILLALLAAAVGWQGFERIAESQNTVIDEAIPDLRQNHALAELNASIGRAAQQLVQVRNESERVRASTTLFGHVNELNALLDEFRQQGIAKEMLPALRETVRELTRRLREQDDLVRRRGQLQARFDAVASRLVEATAVLNDQADSLVANSAATTTAIASSLYDMVERGASQAEFYAVFDRLVEVDIDALERMYELRLRSANLRALIDQTGDVSDIETLDRLRAEALQTLTIIKRRVGEIIDPQRQSQAQATVQTMVLDSGPLSVSGIFETRRSLIDIENRLSRAAAELADASLRLNRIVQAINTAGSTLINRVSTLAKAELQRSRTLFLWIALLSLLVAGLVLGGYIQRNVIRRLVALESATRAIANGRYDVELDDDGNDELSSMSRALRVFRNNALEKQRLDDELLRYKTQLEDQVRVRTEELQHANARLADEAHQHALAREKAEQANRAKTAFLATMSHELRTPLSGALGTLRLLSDTALEQRQQQLVETIEGANAALLDILNDILGYSQIEAGKLHVENRPFQLHGLLDGVTRLMSAAALEKGNRLSLRIEPGTPSGVVTDSGKLRQILLNLIGNANKFTDSGRIDVHVRGVASQQPAHIGIEFSVTDTGIGIAPDRQAEVLQPFTQVDSSTTRTHGGIGLGLAICERLVHALGGELSLRSTPGQGTCVSFSIQAGLVTDLPSDPAPCEAPSWPVAEPLDVLVVEDDSVNRSVVTSYLRKMGHRVIEADSGDRALALLAERRVSLVLLDISLPGMDGLAVLRGIRANRDASLRALPVVAMSAHIFDEEVSEYLDAGMDGYLGKPFSIEDLHCAMVAVAAGERHAVVAAVPARGERLLDTAVVDADRAALGTATVDAMLGELERTSQARFARLARACAQGEFTTIAQTTHQLRGAAANFGLDLFCAALECMEHDALAGRMPAVSLDELRSLYRRSMAALAAHLGHAVAGEASATAPQDSPGQTARVFRAR